MNNSEALTQQSWLLHSWLEAAPFYDYRGWSIRAYPDGTGWGWEVVEPCDLGSGWFESGTLYASRSKALLEARRFVNQITFNHTMMTLLEEFQEQGLLSFQEHQALLESTQCPVPVALG
ncbi:MAG: hypothetical protein VKJ24_14805 [Synechococcales bacterium]|nr:hypothetical protein [Synechococcales bacterium]